LININQKNLNTKGKIMINNDRSQRIDIFNYQENINWSEIKFSE